MATGTGLSVKERLALLQNSDNNNNSKQPTSPSKPGPAATATEGKPQGVAGLKPVTANKPFTPNKPAVVNKPAVTNKPVVGSKPAPANKPVGGVKPPVTPTKPAAGEDDKSKAQDAPLFPKLRPVSARTESGITPSLLKNRVSSQDTGQEALPSEPKTSAQETGGTDSVDSSTMKENPNSISPSKPVSIQERLAALKKKAGVDESIESKPKENSDSGTPASSSHSPAKFSAFPKTPASTTSGVLKPVNGPKAEDAGSKPGFQPVKPSDLAKSINMAADRVLRNKAADKESEEKRSSQLFQRHSDGRKFRKLDVASVTSSAPAPNKPSRLENVDLTPFLKAYASAKGEKLEVDAAKDKSAEAGDEEVFELYVEAGSTSVPIRGKGSIKRAATLRVSQIPEFTEEEEEQELHSNGTLGQALGETVDPEETYDDCGSTLQVQEEPRIDEDPDEIYEPLDDELDATPEPSPSADDKRAKEKEKEKEENAKKKEKAKEEMNKKEEKERKKKEEELKKLRRKFGLSDSDEKVGDGIVKNNASGGVFSKDLSVTKGEAISILRMDGNPAGKWLVQNEQGKMGFVNSNNIEISTPTIRNLMSAVKTENGAEEEPEEMYEALPDGEMDEIYEEL